MPSENLKRHWQTCRSSIASSRIWLILLGLSGPSLPPRRHLHHLSHLKLEVIELSRARKLIVAAQCLKHLELAQTGLAAIGMLDEASEVKKLQNAVVKAIETGRVFGSDAG